MPWKTVGSWSEGEGGDGGGGGDRAMGRHGKVCDIGAGSTVRFDCMEIFC